MNIKNKGTTTPVSISVSKVINLTRKKKNVIRSLTCLRRWGPSIHPLQSLDVICLFPHPIRIDIVTVESCCD